MKGKLQHVEPYKRNLSSICRIVKFSICKKIKKLETALSFVEKKNLKTLRSTASVSK